MQATFADLNDQQLEAFGREIAEVGGRVRAKLGNDDDAWYLRALIWTNRACEVVGRGLIHFSFEPITYILGVIILSIHFNLEVTFGHNCGHGAFNSLRGRKGLDRYNTGSYHPAKLPASFKGWIYSHNGLHHSRPNVVGDDPDTGFELLRVTRLQGRSSWLHHIQLYIVLLTNLPTFLVLGYRSYLIEGRRDTRFAFRHSSGPVLRDALKRQLTENRYFLYNWLLYPLLAGVFFLSLGHALKVLSANLLAEALRGLTYGSMFHMGHHTGTVKFYRSDFEPANKAEWYLLQAETAHNVNLRTPLKHVFGGLDLQIEHHLFPDLPPNRLHEIRPDIERICKKYGVNYSNASFLTSARLFLQNYARHAH